MQPDHARRLDRIRSHPGRGGCGIVALAELSSGPSHALIRDALRAITCMEHRGGCLGRTGDGAGLLLRPERGFFERFLAPGRTLAGGETLVVGTVFLRRGDTGLRALQREFDGYLRREGLEPFGWRTVPVRPEALGAAAREDMPSIRQVFVGRGHRPEEHLASALATVRRQVEDDLASQVSVPSLNPYTVVYKALATGAQLVEFYPDLRDERLETRVVLGHRRYSTNTFSNWGLVQPFRVLAHNGEINTIRANTRAIQDLERALGLHNVLVANGSDSAQLDRAVELMAHERANNLAEAMRRLVPPVWRTAHVAASEQRFFEASQRVLGTLGAWDGPAALVATDGNVLVAMLDRLGLRPLRWVELRGGRVVVSSEIGAVAVEPTDIVRDGQLEPGAMLVGDLAEGELVGPERSAAWIAERADADLGFGDLSTTALVPVARDLEPEPVAPRALNKLGWNRERLQRFREMAKGGKEMVHSMGNDRPLGIFRENHPRLFSFLNQIVAVVTNPAIDPLREGEAMDLTVYLGRSPSLDERGSYRVSPQYKLDRPLLTNEETASLKTTVRPGLRAHVLDATFLDPGNASVLSRRIHALAEEAVVAVHEGATILVVSDREAARTERLPLPGLLVVGALHRYLAKAGLRRKASIVVETGEVQEGHDLAVLLAYGATAVNPYAMLALAGDVKGVEPADARDNVVESLLRMLRRIMSKMGITTIDGYRGSALFEAIALSPEVIDYFLPDTESNLGGVTLADLYEGIVARARGGDRVVAKRPVAVYRKEVTEPLQLVARNGNAQGDYDRLAKILDETPPVYLRDVLDFVDAEPAADEPAPVDEVVRSAFRGAAMSHGALHSTAHRAIAAAFNHFGGRSNSGEGGEDPRRNPGGPWERDRNRIRQVASGRFGVDAAYLAGADEIEIKIGQGAKPGEGGHLPGHKVTAEIARIRHTRPGIALISPPPHHDIYSIEDLAQLIRNLREVNPAATLGVKVPSVTNLGTIAVGIAKAGADVITVSGCSGGTGAAYSGSIFHAGVPLERGLTEAHQYLVANGIRDRVRLCADGGIKYAPDVAKVLALGADCAAFGTALLVAENCVFCRGCNHGNCPVGITTQDKEKQQTRWMLKHNPELEDALLDERYVEARQGVIRYLTCVAEHLRSILRGLGLRHSAELVGRVDLLHRRRTGNERWDRLDVAELLADFREDPTRAAGGPATEPRGDGGSPLNRAILDDVRAQHAAAAGEPARIELVLEPGANEAVGATLAGAIARGDVSPGAGIEISARGFAGQGFGFAATSGMRLRLEGYANDVVGESMGADARIVVVPPRERTGESLPHLAGNAAAYGATGGTLFVAGSAGQRFGVRNSGATLVAEGVGEYAFEYMTGGLGVVVGPVGMNFGSGLTGGEAVVYDPEDRLASRLHRDVVIAGDVEPERVEDLRALLEEFVRETASPRVEAVLNAWDRAAPAFRWVHSCLLDELPPYDEESALWVQRPMIPLAQG